MWGYLGALSSLLWGPFLVASAPPRVPLEGARLGADLVTLSEALLTPSMKDGALEAPSVSSSVSPSSVPAAPSPRSEVDAFMKDLGVADLKGAEAVTQKLASGPRCAAGSLEDLTDASTASPASTSEESAFGRPRSLASFYVFVTLSMKDATLKALYRDVQKIGGRLVIRGLLNNDFKTTQARLLALKIGVDIDPPLLKTFEVTEVPTFLHVQEKTGEAPLVYDRLRGNVTVSYALSQFAERGEGAGVEKLQAALSRAGP